MGLNQPCTGKVVGVAHLGQCMVTNVWLTLDNAWSQMRGLNHSTASDALGFKTTLGDTRMA